MIGNPPYGASFSQEEDKYLTMRNKVFSKIKDFYICFIEKGFQLLKNQGRFSFIIPSSWIGGPRYIDFRSFLLSKQIEKLILLPYDVFTDAYIDTAIAVFANTSTTNDHLVNTYVFDIKEKLVQIDLKENQYDLINQRKWEKIENQKFILSSMTIKLMETIQKNCSLALNDIALMKRGVLFDKSLLTKSKKSEKYFPYFEGNVYRYFFHKVVNQYIEFGDKMKERPKDFFWFQNERILLRKLVNRRLRLMGVVVEETFITNKNLYSIIAKDRDINIFSLLIILNSKLISYLYLKQVTQARKDDFPQITIKDILSLPFPQKNKVLSEQNRIEKLAKEMLSTQEEFQSSKTEPDKEIIQKKIDLLDRQLDALVYELYGLSDEEIRIVEGG